ncbi:MAG: hypothetical protein IPN76_20005 [Saprospiraceae bacterium]|jgi:long-subunit fatty acid transport protein|nr:hypothetical protein [Saprospiraceae bacterium]
MPNFLKDFRGGLTTLSLLLITTLALAQPKDNSPYSRLGMGEILYPTLSASGMGGLSAAYADPLHINFQNPASLAWLTTAAFEAGLFAEKASLEFGDDKSKIWTGNLSHLALAFPLHNTLNDVLDKKRRKLKWGMGFSLTPYSLVGYDIETTRVFPEIDTTTNTYQGTGGSNKAIWSNSVRFKNYSFGANIGYIFGQLERTRTVVFDDLSVSYQDIFRDNISIRGFVWSAGAQYVVQLEDKKLEDEIYTGKSLIIGAYGNSATSFNTNSTELRMRQNTIIGHRDTLLYEQDQEGSGKLPAEWTVGLMYQNPGKLRLGLEYTSSKWSDYENDAKPETLFDSRRIAVGAEYIPDIASYNNYLRRIRYRAGFYHRTDPRLDDLKQYALTVGFGLPVILPRQQTSFVNLAFEFGRFDTSNAIKENFVKMSLGFTLNDSSWFFKRKFG